MDATTRGHGSYGLNLDNAIAKPASIPAVSSRKRSRPIYQVVQSTTPRGGLPAGGRAASVTSWRLPLQTAIATRRRRAGKSTTMQRMLNQAAGQRDRVRCWRQVRDIPFIDGAGDVGFDIVGFFGVDIFARRAGAVRSRASFWSFRPGVQIAPLIDEPRHERRATRPIVNERRRRGASTPPRDPLFRR